MSFQNKPTHLEQAFANAGDKNDIPETTVEPAKASYNVGFPAVTRLPIESGGLPPHGKDFNGLFYKGGSVFDLYAQAGGTFQLNTDILSNNGYPKYATLIEDDGIYMSLVDNNTDNYKTTPSVIGSTWKCVVSYIKFKASLSLDQIPTTTVRTKIQFDTVEYDIGGYYDNATNFRYKPLVSGKYMVVANINCVSDSAIAGEIFIYRNGASHRFTSGQFTVASQLALTISSIVELNGTTDYIEIFGTITSAGTILFDNNFSEFSVFRVNG